MLPLRTSLRANNNPLRPRTRRNAIENADDEHTQDQVGSDVPIIDGVAKSAVETAEGVIRKLTKNEEYQFGDISRGALSEATHVAEDAVRAVTGQDTYQLGDLTRGIMKEGEVAVAAAGKYKVGDLTRGIGRRALDESLESSLVDLPSQLQDMLGNLSVSQAAKLRVQLLQCFGLGALSLNFVMNACTGVIAVAAWAATARGGASPLASVERWGVFLRVVGSIRLVTMPVLIPAQCAAGYFLVFPYWRAVQKTQKILFRGRMERSQNRQIMDRLISMSALFLFGNILALASATFLGILVVGAITGVPFR